MCVYGVCVCVACVCVCVCGVCVACVCVCVLTGEQCGLAVVVTMLGGE